MPHSNLSIASAIHEVIRRRKQQRQQRKRRRKGETDGIQLNTEHIINHNDNTPIDVVAICLEAQLKSTSAVELLLVDGSIPHNKCIKVCLYGTAAMNAVVQSNHSSSSVLDVRGKVVRLNRLSMISKMESCVDDLDDNDDDWLTRAVMTPNEGCTMQIICEFRCDTHKDPEAGCCFAVLSGRMVSGSKEGVNLCTVSIGSTMETSCELIEQLEQWFDQCPKRKFFNRNLGNFREKVTCGAVPLESGCMTSCQYRNLCDITLPGTLSNIFVKVRSFDILCEPWKAPRHSKQMAAKPRYLLAVLEDVTQPYSILTLHRCCRFRRDIERIRHENRKAKIMSVLALQDSDELFLVPTSSTTILILDEERFDEGEHSLQQSCNNLSQHSLMKCTESQYNVSPKRVQKVVNLRIADFFVIDKMIYLSNKIFRLVPGELASILIEKNVNDDASVSFKYRRAILTLVPKSSPSDEFHLKVTVDPSIVKKLCADVSPEVFGGDKLDLVRSQLVKNFLLGLIEEKIELKWTIEKSCSDEKWKVNDVKLLSI